MKPIVQFCSLAAPIIGRNIDTDQIVPARFLKMDRRLAGGYGPYLFHDLRHDAQGAPEPGFILNQPKFSQAKILVAEHNFGCGSSREGAVYSLADAGFQAVIAPSFGDIFASNCLKNGMLPIRLDEQVVTELIALLLAGTADCIVQVDLEQQSVQWGLPGTRGGVRYNFAIDAFWRECLLKGVDEIDLTLSYMDQISAFEADYMQQNPWLNSI